MYKIISGGQDGVDIAALKAAKKAGLHTGGILPNDCITISGKKEDLTKTYNLIELKTIVPQTQSMSLNEMYVLRSQMNVDTADATLAIRLCPSSGTDRTINYAISKMWSNEETDRLNFSASSVIKFSRPTYKPIFIITTLSSSKKDEITNAFVQFIARNKVKILNVAGHREYFSIAKFESFMENFFLSLFSSLH